MPAIHKDVLVDAIRALDRVTREVANTIENTDLRMTCARVAGQLSAAMQRAESAAVHAGHEAVVDELVAQESGQWGGPAFGTTRFYLGESITRTEYAASARRQGFTS